MPIRDIACLNCGFAGMLDIHYENEAAPKDHLFKPIGHNLLYGYHYYRCPVCKIILLVDPKAFLEEKSLKGFPNWLADLQTRQRRDYKSLKQNLFRWFKRTESKASVFT